MAVKRNPIDAVWADRPEPSKARLVVQPNEFAGQSSADKRHEMADWLAKEGADAAVLAALDSIAWTFNVRGPTSPIRRSRWPLRWSMPTAPPTCSSRARRSATTSAPILGNGVRLHERDEFETYLRSLSGKLVAVDPERSVAAISQALDEGGARILSRRDPAVLPKAVKNPVEVAGHKAAQARDGAAVSRFLQWVEEEAPKGGLDEIIAADKLLGFRQELGGLKRPQLRHDFRLRTQRRAAPLQGHGGIQPAASRPARSTWSIPAASIRTARPTSPAPCRSASRPRR